jgi:predicted ATP-dependent serine protease
MTDIFSNLDTVLDEDFRHPIPIGIPGIDRLLKGGLAKGEIGVILAPTGVGKTTILTKIANTAFNLGYNVLQIFFEDNPKIVQRKHFTLWTGIEPDNLLKNKVEVSIFIVHNLTVLAEIVLPIQLQKPFCQLQWDQQLQLIFCNSL